MDVTTLISASLAAAAMALLVLAWPLLRQWRQRREAARTIDAALQRQAAHGVPVAQGEAVPGQPQAAPAATQATALGAAAAAPQMSARAAAAAAALAQASPRPAAAARPRPATLGARLGEAFGDRFNQRWLESRLGRAVVTAEEQQLLEQCGFHGLQPRAVFGGLRLLVPAVLAGAMLLWRIDGATAQALACGFATFALGYLLPKMVLRRWARNRQREVAEELPVLIDMLRLLQGVGLSIDQSLQVIVTEFGAMLRVLGSELQRANQQFASGRSREQTLQRIGKLFDDEDLKSLITLLTQVDKHGGAVQEPLRQFGERLQVARKARMKDKIGRLTVKMTGVMVVSLLPVLLILTAGPGFLGVIRMLARMNGGHG
ncbi:type II secretion system F family protein [Cupriavidus pauculus]|uniref:Pilus assembly protein TadC n=1 Tax=Cupriavidus pauculus TaxID=82633 RepID=A0A2N5CFM8_9BURK|nr:type II secretion system F family protein [Cupriavidus pauculus]PLQ01014.1 pilus assembly protein TadC [Cupriavidus pauculus]